MTACRNRLWGYTRHWSIGIARRYNCNCNYTTLHCITRITSKYTALHYSYKINYPHYSMLHHTNIRYIMSHYSCNCYSNYHNTTLQYTTPIKLHYANATATLLYFTIPCPTLHYTKLLYTTLQYSSVHYFHCTKPQLQLQLQLSYQSHTLR